ncbi:MAG: hypothetical protein KDB03_18975 [Planctomycetales bacterium]|nr:hypothetical protein [Planctomycetales bacterium]
MMAHKLTFLLEDGLRPLVTQLKDCNGHRSDGMHARLPKAAMNSLRFCSLLIFSLLTTQLLAQERSNSDRFQMHRGIDRQEVIHRTLEPYSGNHSPGVHASTLVGKVMCGYQGWFTCPGDGSGRGWHHWQKGHNFAPGSCTIDLWPDVSELDDDERFQTSFLRQDGRQAEVFSSLNAKTVDRHFQWMAEYGIDGVFVQRFGTEVRDPMGLYHFNTVLAHARAGANRHGRTWAVMYDLSGLRRGETQIVIDDWKMLVDRMLLGCDPRDPSYLHHNGKPVVTVWGIGFSDGREYTLDECEALVDFFTNDAKYGGNTVMLGIPTYWRSLTRDCVADAKLHEIIKSADIISPWMVGRIGTLDGVERIARDVWQPDLTWCQQHNIDYLPVVFPGFSWHNMNPKSPLDQIPRQGGRFLWKQYSELQKIGATMVYQAMFDEVDEATAIFKCTNSPPLGQSTFLDYEGLPSDHYLWLTGQGRRLIRGELQPTEQLPIRRIVP